jgi:hypothetical protein
MVFFVKTPTEQSSCLPRPAVGEVVTLSICTSNHRVLNETVIPTERIVVEGPAVSFCPSDLTTPNKSHDPPLVIPSAAEGPAVRPGSRTKVSVPLVLPQTRHPARPGLPWERSASPVYRATLRLGAESKDPGGAYLT